MDKSSILLTPKGDKLGNKSMQLTPIRQQIQTDFCQNRQKFKASVCSYQSSKNLQQQVQAKVATKTPIKMQPKSFVKTHTKSNGSAPKFDQKVLKLTIIIKKEETSGLDLKSVPAILVTNVHTNQNANEIESAGKCNIDSKLDSNIVREEAVKAVNEEIDLPLQICVKIEETSTTENEPSTGEEENTLTQQQDAAETPTKNEFVETKDDDIKIPSSQLKWTEEVLNLLNTGSEDDLSKTLATIGPKTAIRITRCRKNHGNFDQIADLPRRLGWSDKVHQKFLSKNFL